MHGLTAVIDVHLALLQSDLGSAPKRPSSSVVLLRLVVVVNVCFFRAAFPGDVVEQQGVVGHINSLVKVCFGGSARI